MAASLAKLRSISRFRQALVDFGFRQYLVTPLSISVPLMEIIAAVMLILPPFRIAGAAGAVIMLVVFTSLLLHVVVNRTRVQCACFGSATSDFVTRRTVGRNVILIVLVMINFFYKAESFLPSFSSVEWRFRNGLVVSGLVASTLVIVLLSLRIAGAVAKRQQTKVGSKMPSVLIIDPSASIGVFPNPLLMDEGGKSHLIVVGHGCPSCEELIENLAKSGSSYGNVTIAWIAEGSRQYAGKMIQSAFSGTIVPSEVDKLSVSILPTMITINPQFYVTSIDEGSSPIGASLLENGQMGYTEAAD